MPAKYVVICSETYVNCDLPARAPELSTCAPPLVVDLDGTLIASDTMVEALVALCRNNPCALGSLIPSFLRGRSYFKCALLNVAELDPSALPYREDILSFIAAARRNGAATLLATAAPEKIAFAIAKHLKLFDDVVATTPHHNLKGSAKLAAIRQWCEGRGFSVFAYLGDSAADLPIWAAAETRLAVEPPSGVQAKLKRMESVTLLATRPSLREAALPIIRAVRPHQWAKNLLVFVPPLCAQQLLDPRKATLAFLAFFALSLTASAGYVINDFFDVHADRLHPRKRRRPFAAALLPLWIAPVIAASLLTVGMLTAWLGCGIETAALVAGYLMASFVYTFTLKQKLLVDVMALAGLYTMRLIIGAAATNAPASRWLIAFSMFLFLSLAFAKRYAEVLAITQSPPANRQIPGRGYSLADSQIILSAGVASGYVATLVFALYINDPTIMGHYRRPDLLLLLCPLLLYWITRIWFITVRGNMHDDPLIFALQDTRSFAVVALFFMLFIAAII